MTRVPIFLADAAGNPVTGLTLSGAEVQVSKDGGALANGTGGTGEIGLGAYWYDLQAGEIGPHSTLLKVRKTGTRGFDYFRSISEPVDIAVGEPTAAGRRVPFLLVTTAGDRLAGAPPTPGTDIQLSKNGGAWFPANTGGTVGEVGGGDYYYQATVGEVGTSGFLLTRVAAPGCAVVICVSIIGAGSATVVSNLQPAAGTPVYPDTPLYFEVTNALGFTLLIPMILMDPFRLPEPTYADGAFEPLYSDSTRHDVGSTAQFTIRRKQGWYATPRLVLYAVATDGTIWVGP